MLHSNCLYTNTCWSISDQNIENFKITKLLGIVSIYLILNSLFLKTSSALFIKNIRCPAQWEDIELLIIFVQVLLTLDIWIVWNWIIKLILCDIKNHELVVRKVLSFLVHHWDEVYHWCIIWDSTTSNSDLSKRVWINIIRVWLNAWKLVVFDVNKSHFFYAVMRFHYMHQIIWFYNINMTLALE